MKKSSYNRSSLFGFIIRFLAVCLFLTSAQTALYALASSETITLNETETDGAAEMSYLIDFLSTSGAAVTVDRRLFGGWRGASFDPRLTEVTLSAGSSGDVNNRALIRGGGSETLFYNIYTDSNHTKILKGPDNDYNSENMLTHLFPSEQVGSGNTSTQKKTHSYYLRIPENQFVPAGTYYDNLLFYLYRQDQNDSVDETSLAVTVTVPHYLALSITGANVYVPGSSSGSLELGTLTDYMVSNPINAVARANIGYKILAYSTNSGSMKHDSVDEYVPYTLSFGSSSNIIDLSSATSESPVTAAESSTMTQNTGRVYPITVTLGVLGWKPAGDYSDNIHFLITTD